MPVSTFWLASNPGKTFLIAFAMTFFFPSQPPSFVAFGYKEEQWVEGRNVKLFSHDIYTLLSTGSTF